MWWGICGYLHVKCSGLKNKKEWKNDFICVNCEPPPQVTQPAQNLSSLQIIPPPDFPLTPGNVWNMMTVEHCQKLKIIYKEIVHWRPKLFTLKMNKAGPAFTDTLHTTLSALQNRSQDALLVGMVMPYLFLQRTKSKND